MNILNNMILNTSYKAFAINSFLVIQATFLILEHIFGINVLLTADNTDSLGLIITYQVMFMSFVCLIPIIFLEFLFATMKEKAKNQKSSCLTKASYICLGTLFCPIFILTIVEKKLHIL